jgi:hypothetical protein
VVAVTVFPGLTENVEHFRKRVAQDALAEATARYWNARAAVFESVLPQPGDFTGNATPQEVEAGRRRIIECAQACRNRASVSLIGGDL